MPRRPRGGGYSERASLNSRSLVREEGGPEAAAHAATEPAGILSRVQPDRGDSVCKEDGQDLRSSGYGAAVILRRAIPSCEVQFAERARFLGSRIQSGLSQCHIWDRGCAWYHVGKVAVTD